MGVVSGARCRKYCALVLLDVKNAFNTARWSRLAEVGVTGYLRNIMSDYFRDREVSVANESMKMWCLPSIWQWWRLQMTWTAWLARVDEALMAINEWMTANSLELAPNKTETVLLKGGTSRRLRVEFRLGDSILPGHVETVRREAREATLERWQARWDKEQGKAQGPKIIIPNLKRWSRCSFRKLTYGFTQFLTGHGSFKKYTHRIGKDAEDACTYCGIEDSAEHIGMRCARWREYRAGVAWWEEDMEAADVIDRMLGRESDWRSGMAAIDRNCHAQGDVGGHEWRQKTVKASPRTSSDDISNRMVPRRDSEYGGVPFTIKDKLGRGCKPIKFYSCIFIYLATKAVHLEFEGFYTLLVQIESTLNSRPIIPLSSDPNDLEALAPSFS